MCLEECEVLIRVKFSKNTPLLANQHTPIDISLKCLRKLIIENLDNDKSDDKENYTLETYYTSNIILQISEQVGGICIHHYIYIPQVLTSF